MGVATSRGEEVNGIEHHLARWCETVEVSACKHRRLHKHIRHRAHTSRTLTTRHVWRSMMCNGRTRTRLAWCPCVHDRRGGRTW